MSAHNISFAPHRAGYKRSATSAHSSELEQAASGPEALHLASYGAPASLATPVKKRTKLTHLGDLDKSPAFRGTATLDLDNFVQGHLSSLPTHYQTDHSFWLKNNVPSITKRIRHEALYKPVCDLLNLISNHLYSFYQTNNLEVPHEEPVFFFYHDFGSSSSRDLSQGKPDLLVAFGSLASPSEYQKYKRYPMDGGIPCFNIISMVECKPSTEPSDPWAMRCVETLLEVHTDMVGLYGLSANDKEYSIFWSDASRTVSSPPILWHNLAPLERYVYSLYYPHNGHRIPDPTLLSPARHVPPKGEKEELDWSIVRSKRPFEKGHRFHATEGWSRRTSVYMFNNREDDLTIIEAVYRDDRRPFEGAAFLCHSGGNFPDVLCVVNPGPVAGLSSSPITNPCPAVDGVTHQEKKRLVIGNRSSKLENARSVRDILITVLDGIEVHRVLVNEKGYLHGDISTDSFFFYPERVKNTKQEMGSVEDSPPSINDTLGIANGSYDNCRALFIDEDNSPLLGPPHGATSEDVCGELAYRTGTPRFIARAVSIGESIGNVKRCNTFVPMPQLSGKAKDAYIKAYGQDMYDEYSDKASETVHGRGRPKLYEDPRPFTHRPDHDVESIFWVLLFTLLLATPKDSQEKPSRIFYAVIKRMMYHTIDPDEIIDLRDRFFHLTLQEWSNLFHHKLSPIVPMMDALADQVYPEYGLLDPPPKQDHLHEVFRRILLNQILLMEDKIPLAPGVLRNPDPTASILTATPA